jgi:thioredoxin reductase
MSADASGASGADFDAIVIGAGPAGLSAALYLGRARRRTLVLDSGKPRNAASPSAHGVFTRDGTPPSELRAEARRQLSDYASVTLRDAEAVSAVALGNGFRVGLAGGASAVARRLLLACGIRDALPAIPGLADHWGEGVLHCTTCHGHEAADRALALIVRADVVASATKSVLQVSRDLVVCTDGPNNMSPAERGQLEAHGAAFVETPITRVSGAPPRLSLHLEDGSSIECEAIFVRTTLSLASALPIDLGCELAAPHRLVVTPNWETTVPGVYAAGDIAALKDQVTIAAASGAHAAIALNNDLLQEDFQAPSREIAASSEP